MAVMARKTKNTEPAVEPEGVPPILFRPETRELVDAIEAEAKRERRSRNLMMQILFEEALRARGAWPVS